MKIRNIGGRGHKADFPTIAKRVPIAIQTEIDRLIEDMYKSIDRNIELPFQYLPSVEDLIAICLHILKSKKSASKSLEKLLVHLYKDESITLSLKDRDM